VADAILVLNAGSSSLKFSVFRAGGGTAELFRGQVESLGDDDAGRERALASVLERCAAQPGDNRIVAAGHRVVHGGVKFAAPVRVDDGVLAELERLVPLAPLHQPHNLAAVRAVERLAPGLPQVACFDTAFHRTQPEVAQRFALPRRFTDEGVRRYGFHGLSYEYIASVLPRLDPRAAAGRTVVAHLGNGASLCAMLGGRSVATTMSFTPADGVVMGTRTGSLDPGVLLYLMNRHGMDAAALEHLIYHESGLLGVSGVSGDMRELLASGDPRAAEAVDLFVYRIGRELGSLAAALGGLDALVFTAGIGENAAAVRDRVVRDAGWLGSFRVHVIPTNEELMIADHTRQVLGLPEGG
jgi:acetate kinase